MRTADNWAENGRDLLNFIAYYLDAQDANSDSSDSLPRPAPDVPPELGLLDNVASIDTGSAIPTERTYRGRLIVGIGHSLGGSATVFAATACPALFSSLVLVDPVLSPPTMFDPRKTALVAMGALRRRGVWNSRKEAKESFLAKPFFRAWDPRIVDGYVDLGMHELGTGQVALKTKPFYEAVSPSFAALAKFPPHLEQTPAQKQITFLGSLCDTSLRSTLRLQDLTRCLPLHYIFADTGRSMLPEEATSYLLEHATPHATWTRVPGAGHLVSLEKPTETAHRLAEFLETTYPNGGGGGNGSLTKAAPAKL